MWVVAWRPASGAAAPGGPAGADCCRVPADLETGTWGLSRVSGGRSVGPSAGLRGRPVAESERVRLGAAGRRGPPPTAQGHFRARPAGSGARRDLGALFQRLLQAALRLPSSELGSVVLGSQLPK